MRKHEQILSTDKAVGTPSSYDYRETRRILSDFGVPKIAVPEFETTEQLVRWRRTTINAHLDNWRGALITTLL